MKFCLIHGINCHYEMLGYILYFCKINNYSLDIYANTYDIEWLYFYIKIFKIQIMDILIYKSDPTILDNYNFIFFPTDDDIELNLEIFLKILVFMFWTFTALNTSLNFVKHFFFVFYYFVLFCFSLEAALK